MKGKNEMDKQEIENQLRELFRFLPPFVALWQEDFLIQLTVDKGVNMDDVRRIRDTYYVSDQEALAFVLIADRMQREYDASLPTTDDEDLD